ncbi:S8 family serine peptidase, partial [Candidatus Woesearchaeota archaeon]|nr:S8 family serine peptidase [Candidatus Woesearchaeota archaeon]
AWNSGYKGSGVKVAVLDTGIDDNEAFEDRIIMSEDFVNSGSVLDYQGHGTHVAGIVAGDGKYKGVAPDAHLMNAKVLDDYGRGSTSSIISGIEWAVDNDADIISLSLGAPVSEDIPLNDALQDAMDNGVIAVVASGNCGKGCSGFEGVTSPGNYEDVITVGAVDGSMGYADFSSGQNIGLYIKPDIVAPGVDIMSYYTSGSYKSMSGTSMATPHVAGAAALLLEKNSSLSHYEMKALLEQHAVDLGAAGKDVEFGAGFLDVEKMIDVDADEGEEKEEEEDADADDDIYYGPINDFVCESGAIQTQDYNQLDLKSLSVQSSEGFVRYCKIFYEMDLNKSFIINIKSFDRVDQIITYFSDKYTSDYFNSLIDEIDGHYILVEQNNIIWVNDYEIYSLRFNHGDNYDDLLNDYLTKFPSDIKADLDQTIINLKDIQIGKESEFAVEELQMIREEEQRLTEEQGLDYSDMENYVSQGSCSDCGAGWTNICDEVECEGLGNCYYKSYLICANIPSNGDSDYCYYKKSELNGCAHGEYDCDWDSECSGSLECSGVIDAGCCRSDEKWNTDSHSCDKVCDKGYSGELKCGLNDVVKKEYIYEDCSTNWVVSEDCNDDDHYGGWTDSYCDEDDVKRRKTYYDYSCSAGKCISSTSYEYDTVETCSNGCSGGRCSECNSDSDCPDEGWTGSKYCYDGDVYQDYEEGDCSGGDCGYDTDSRKKEDCSNGCAGGVCISGPICGDDSCDDGEECPEDCLEISILDYDSSVYAGEEVVIKLGVRNIGTVEQTGNFEVGIIPSDFFAQEYSSMGSSEKITSCCPENKYYSARKITRGEGENQYSEFTLRAPTKSEYDHCDDQDPASSAWGDSFIVVAGGYDGCYKDGGDGYYTYMEESIDVKYDLSLVDYELEQSIIGKGEEFTLRYEIDNEGSRRDIGLGATIRAEDGKEYNDYDNDDVVSVSSGKHWYSRDFRIPSDAEFGEYDVAWGLHMPDSDENFAMSLEFSDPLFSEDALSVAGCGDGACNYGETINSCFDDCGVCEHPFGGSSECSCPLLECNTGYHCDLDLGYGTCVEDSCETPDGSSSSCDCDSNDDCEEFDMVCDLQNGWDACIEKNEPDECEVLDEYSCGNDGNVYRCEIQNGRKVLMLADVCTYNEVCPEDVSYHKQCRNTIDYDLKLEYASSGTVVNKQPGDILSVDAGEYSSELEYDSSAFILQGCDSGTCEFEVDSDSEGKYSFKLEDDVEVVNVIDDPYTLYMTHAEQLYSRYDDKRGVDVLLAKTYEKASQKRGIVYDLNEYLGEDHPFDYSFGNYDEEQILDRNNDYPMKVSRFINGKCNDCKETIIVGDDYVVPSYVSEAIFDENWFPGWDNLNDYSFYSDHPIASSYTGNNDLMISDLEIIFSQKDYEGDKQVVLIIPSDINEMRGEIDLLKESIGSEFMTDDIHEISADELYLGNYGPKGATLIIVGTPQTNRILKEYYLSSHNNDQDFYIDRNQWDKDEYALIVNTKNPLEIKYTGLLISSQQYKNIHGESIKWAPLIGGAVLIAVSPFTGPAAPFVAGAGVILMSADTVDSCLIENQNLQNLDECGADVVLEIAGAGIGKLLGKIGSKFAGNIFKKYGKVGGKKVFKNLDELAKVGIIGKESSEKLLRESIEEGSTKLKYISDGADFIKQLDELDSVAKNLKSLDDVKRVRFLEGFGKTSKEYGLEHTETSLKKSIKYAKLWKGNPFDNPKSMHNVIGVFDSPHTTIKFEMVDETIDSAAVLKQGVKEDWGYKHIFEYVRPGATTTRAQQIMKKFDLNNNKEVLEKIDEAINKGSYQGLSDNGFHKLIYEEEGGALTVFINKEGSIHTIIPKVI